MIRELFIAAAITGTAVGMAPTAVADPGHYDGDVPGINYDASLGAPCDNYERFIFGRGPGGQAEACHFITNQFPAAQSGFWVITYPLNGVQQVGAPCQNPRGSSAQSEIVCETRSSSSSSPSSWAATATTPQKLFVPL